MDNIMLMVDELTGPSLDWALKMALQTRPVIRTRYNHNPNGGVAGSEFYVYGEPSKDVESLMYLFYRHDINLVGNKQGPWACSIMTDDGVTVTASSDNKLEAIARVFVKSKLGLVVEVPVELVEGVKQ